MLAMRWGFTALADALTIASDNGMARFYHSLRTVFAAFLAEPIPLSSCKVLGNVKHGDGEDSEEKETDLVPIDLPDIGIHATEMPPTATEQRACLHALDAALTDTLTASASQLGPVEKQHALRFMRHLAPVHSTHPSHLYHILNSGGLMSLARQDSSLAMTEAIEMRSKLLALLNTDGELVAFLGRFGLHPPIEAAPLDDLAPVHYLTYYLRERAHVDLSAGADALGSTGVSAQKWFRRSFKLWLLQIVGGGGAAAGNEGALLVQGFEAAAARVCAAGGFEPAALGRALPTSGAGELLDPFELRSRFVANQKSWYARALSEINAGAKKSHWMWWVIPTPPYVVDGVERGSGGRPKPSPASYTFALRDRPPNQLQGFEAARAYLEFPQVDGVHLCSNLIKILQAIVVQLESGRDAVELMGTLDEPKLRSSALLFEFVTRAPAAGGDAEDFGRAQNFQQVEVNAACRHVLSLLHQQPWPHDSVNASKYPSIKR